MVIYNQESGYVHRVDEKLLAEPIEGTQTHSAGFIRGVVDY